MLKCGSCGPQATMVRDEQDIPFYLVCNDAYSKQLAVYLPERSQKKKSSIK
jgi:hypothetical protein